MIQNAIKFSSKHKNSENGIRMLFYGLSGTGKTELARYISETMNKKILIKRASDILNKYVGENEQNIKNAFEEAERNDQILLFDEADSFFSDRNSANTSWERTLVNEFLTQMEEFSGILICTTNLRNIMDAALQRRFHLCVEFKPLTIEGITSLLERYFSEYTFTEKQISQLNAYDTITPGDFGSLFGRIRFMDEEDINSDFLIEELIAMQEEKNMNGSGRKVGFSL
jgi:SpoVK/Ycf46/Vps4 family AAA+-type ATPase